MDFFGPPPEFRLALRLRETNQDAWDPMQGLAGMRLRHRQTKPDLDDVLRFGIQFADGRRASTLGPPMFLPEADDVKGPMLMGGAGSGGPFGADTTFWVWPLPPPGPLTFGAEWPKQGIALSLHEVDADLILDAVSRAIELWPAPKSPAGGSGGSYSTSGFSGYTPLRPGPRKRRPK